MENMSRNVRGKTFAEWTVGEAYKTAARTVTESDIVAFAGLSGDFNPLHTDEEYAKRTVHGTRIAHGALTFAIATGLVNQSGLTDGTVIGFLGADVKWTAVVRPGDTIHVTMEPLEKRLAKQGGQGIVKLKLSVLNQANVIVSELLWTLLVVA
jgi:Acyl dehydratase